MDGEEAERYADLPRQIAEIGLRLQATPDNEVAADVVRLLALVEGFHRTGLTRLVGLIQQWRGEIFLEAVEREPFARTLLRSYDLPRSD